LKLRKYSLLAVGVCGLLPAVLGNAAGWPTGLWIFVTITTMSGSALLLTLAHERARTSESEETEEADEEIPYRETRVESAALPSAVDGYAFRFSATVWWRPVPGALLPSESALSSLASAFIVNRARAIACRENPGLASSARYLMEGALGVARQDGSATVTAMATDVALALDPADRDRLHRVVELRKDEQVWEQERQYERNKRAYLGDEVLKSPGSAVVWWLARHEEEIRGAVDLIGPLAQISAAAKDAEIPELYRHLVAGAPGTPVAEDPVTWPSPRTPTWVAAGEEDDIEVLLSRVLERLGMVEGSDERTVFIHRVVRQLEAEERHGDADRVRRAFLSAAHDESHHPTAGAPSGAAPWDGMMPDATESFGSQNGALS
jgi:hypothetical protein